MMMKKRGDDGDSHQITRLFGKNGDKILEVME